MSLSLSINRKNKKSTKLSTSPSLLTAAAVATATGNSLTRKRAFNQHQQQQQQYKQKPKITKIASKIPSLTPLTPILQSNSFNFNADDTLFLTVLEQQPIDLTTQSTTTISASAAAVVKGKPSDIKVDHKIFRSNTAMPSFKIMSYQNIIALLTVLVCGLVTVNGLKCYMCGQYNEGVGSITPCLNYSEQYAHLYLKECSKKSEKYCVVSGKIIIIFFFYFHISFHKYYHHCLKTK